MLLLTSVVALITQYSLITTFEYQIYYVIISMN